MRVICDHPCNTERGFGSIVKCVISSALNHLTHKVDDIQILNSPYAPPTDDAFPLYFEKLEKTNDGMEVHTQFHPRFPSNDWSLQLRKNAAGLWREYFKPNVRMRM